MRNTLAKIIAFATSPMGLLLAILFFVPWLKISCQGMELATATGWQLSTGGASLNESAEKKPKADEKVPEEEDRGIDARPWYFLGLILPIAVLLAGLAGLKPKGPGPGIGALLVILGIGGIVVMILASQVDYAEIRQDMLEETRAQSDNEGINLSPPPEVFAGMISVRAEPPVWISLVIYVVVALCGAALIAIPFLVQTQPSASTTGPPGAAEGEPPPG